MTATLTARPVISPLALPPSVRVVPAPRSEPPTDDELHAAGLAAPSSTAPLLPLALPGGARAAASRAGRGPAGPSGTGRSAGFGGPAGFGGSAGFGASAGPGGFGGAAGPAGPGGAAGAGPGGGGDGSARGGLRGAPSRSARTRLGGPGHGVSEPDDARFAADMPDDARFTADMPDDARFTAESAMSDGSGGAFEVGSVARPVGLGLGGPGKGDVIWTPPPSPARSATRVFLATCVEVIAGFRPMSQLRPLCLPDRFTDIADRLAAHPTTSPAHRSNALAYRGSRVPMVGRAASAPARISRSTHTGSVDRAGIRRVQICDIGTRAAEVAVVLGRREEVWAMALRFELRRGQWLCSLIEIL